MTAPTPRPRSGLSFRLLGVPVRIGPSILVILALFGWSLGSLTGILLWVLIGVFSIVVHELGHALVARAAGASPTIELAGLGGVTRYAPTGRSGRRGWRLAISLAGPGVGFVIGGLALAVRDTVGAIGGTPAIALEILLFTSIGWGVFNLLPILPLDGGQALRQLLPGDDTTRTVRAAWIGVVTSVLLALASVWLNQVFLALFAGLFASQNYRTATAVQQAERARDRLATLLQQRDWRAIRDTLSAGGGDHEVATAAQQGALAHGEFQVAAEIGEVALERGSTDPAFAQRTATAWRALGMEERAARAEARAGAPPSRTEPGTNDDAPEPDDS